MNAWKCPRCGNDVTVVYTTVANEYNKLKADREDEECDNCGMFVSSREVPPEHFLPTERKDFP